MKVLSDITHIMQAYNDGVNSGNFVRYTDWRAIARHETGHVVEYFYHFDILSIAFTCANLTNRIELFDHLDKELSVYSTAYEDGREIISKSFSGYYSKTGNRFADCFVQKCIEIRDSLTKGR